jgi:hypothetical protein
MWGALSDERSVVYNCCWPSPAQSFNVSETSLFVASCNSQGYCGGIRTRLHTRGFTFIPFMWLPNIRPRDYVFQVEWHSVRAFPIHLSWHSDYKRKMYPKECTRINIQASSFVHDYCSHVESVDKEDMFGLCTRVKRGRRNCGTDCIFSDKNRTS